MRLRSRFWKAAVQAMAPRLHLSPREISVCIMLASRTVGVFHIPTLYNYNQHADVLFRFWVLVIAPLSESFSSEAPRKECVDLARDMG